MINTFQSRCFAAYNVLCFLYASTAPAIASVFPVPLQYTIATLFISVTFLSSVYFASYLWVTHGRQPFHGFAVSQPSTQQLCAFSVFAKRPVCRLGIASLLPRMPCRQSAGTLSVSSVITSVLFSCPRLTVADYSTLILILQALFYEKSKKLQNGNRHRSATFVFTFLLLTCSSGRSRACPARSASAPTPSRRRHRPRICVP
jgi:hypothetical protein